MPMYTLLFGLSFCLWRFCT